jgi:hypothetical protein
MSTDSGFRQMAERVSEIRRHHETASTTEAQGMSAPDWAHQHATLAHWERGDLLDIVDILLGRIRQLNDAFEWHDIPAPDEVKT